jgi:hypothetical protein
MNLNSYSNGTAKYSYYCYNKTMIEKGYEGDAYCANAELMKYSIFGMLATTGLILMEQFVY